MEHVVGRVWQGSDGTRRGACMTIKVAMEHVVGSVWQGSDGTRHGACVTR